jgi:hypothetical protein
MADDSNKIHDEGGIQTGAPWMLNNKQGGDDDDDFCFFLVPVEQDSFITIKSVYRHPYLRCVVSGKLIIIPTKPNTAPAATAADQKPGTAAASHGGGDPLPSMSYAFPTVKQSVLPLTGAGADIHGLSISPNDEMIAAGFGDGCVRIYGLETKKRMYTLGSGLFADVEGKQGGSDDDEEEADRTDILRS